MTINRKELVRMRKIICYCNTYFQLIAAIQLKLTLLRNDKVTLALSDNSNNSYKVARKLSEISIFDSIIFTNTKHIQNNQTITIKVREFLSALFGYNTVWKDDYYFDEIIYYNEMDDVYELFAKAYKNNPNILVSRFEEGILSYSSGTWYKNENKIKIANGIRRMSKLKTLHDCYHNFYCFFPDLYEGNMSAVRIPPIEESPEIKDILNTIFDISFTKTSYKQKYIYFSSVLDFQGGKPIGELELVLRIKDLVGSDNLLVKVHPRDNPQRFTNEGITIDTNSNVPWEAIQISKNFSSHVFLSATSSAAIGASLIQKNSPKTYYLFNLCDISNDNPDAIQSVETLYSVLSREELYQFTKDIYIASDLSEILQ